MEILSADCVNLLIRFKVYVDKQGGDGMRILDEHIAKDINLLWLIVQKIWPMATMVFEPRMLMIMHGAEQIIDRGLRNGMDDRMFYKDIFQDVKKRVILFAELHGQSEIIQKQLDLFEK